jgi:hypothetical protein
MVLFDQTPCEVTQMVLFELGKQMPKQPDNNFKSYVHCSVTAKSQGKFTRRQNVERYRRLLQTATDKERQA